MKRMISRMWRSGLSIVLVACLLVGLCPTVAFAKTTELAEETKTIKYVSIGDSMTNGYGFVGYNQDEHKDGYDFKSGTGVYGENAYPLQFEAYLQDQGYEVEHTKLALSALRVENLRYLLGIVDSEPVDDYDAYAGYAGENVSKSELRGIYQNAMKEADVISLALGNASFNAFFFDRVMKVFGNIDSFGEDEERPTLDQALTMMENEEQKQVVREVYNLLKSKLTASIPREMVEQFKLEDLCDLAAYTTASFLLSFESVIEWIGENNEDAEVILVGVINSTSGMTIVGDGWEFDLGSAMDAVYGAINAYTAALPTVMQMSGEYENVKFYYAEQPSNPEMISVKIPALAADNWGTVDGIDGELVRSKTDNAYNSIVVDIAKEKGLVKTTENAIEAIENADENATILSMATSGNSVNQTYAGQLASAIVYLGLEEAIVKSMESTDIYLDAIATFAGDGLSKVFDDAPLTYLNPQKSKSVKEGVEKFSDFFCEEKMLNLVRLFAVSKVGDGISAHPTPATHNEIAQNVIDAYGSHTAKDETIENVEIVLNELYNLLETYGPEAAAQVWAQWEEYGYVEDVETSISELNTMLTKRYTYYTETALPAIAKSVEELSAQKDALTAELAKLKIELEAKQAELADVINNVEIGSIHTPDINIDVQLGGNEQTEVSGNDCVVNGEGIEAELEAAVKDLEHAIAVIEALIADIEADIADMVALAEQIAAAVEELEKTMADVAVAAEDLEKAVKEVINVIKNSDGAVNQVVNSFEAARATAQAAVEVLDLTIDTAEEMMADVDVMIEKIAADAEALYNKFMTELPSCIEQIPEEAMLVAGAIYAAQQAYEDNKEEINANLQAELAKLAAEYGISEENIRTELAELAAEYGISEENIRTELAELTEEYDISEENIRAELAEIEAKITEEVNAKYAEIEAEISVQIENKKAEAAEKLAALEEELKGYQAELEGLAADAAEEVRNQLQTQIDRVNSDIAVVNQDLACAIEHLENAAQEAYEQIVAEVTKVYEETIATLEKQLEELKAAYDEAVAELEKQLEELKAAYDEAVAELEKQLEELKAAYDKAVEELTAAADKAIAGLTEELNKQLEELGKIGEALNDEVNGILTAIREELTDTQKAVEEILKGNLEAIEELKDSLIEMGGEAIVDAVESLIDAVKALIEEATTADLVIDDDFKYVAIGDGSAAPESYVEKLAAALNAEAAENGVDEIELVNYAKAGNTVAAERANLSDVTGADLITIGFSNVEFIANAVNTAINGGEMDWAAIVGAENVQYVDELLAEVAVKIAEAGIEGEDADRVNSAIEAYAYAAMVYATELPELINDIHAVNPDALVIIVGMYNPLEGVVIDLGENVTLDMGEYIDYLIKGVGVHGVAYSILSGNSIYVDAPSVDTINTDKELGAWDLLAIMYSNFADLYPSAVGDDYIAAEIADALNITYVKTQVGLLGDADGNGVVEPWDASLILQYDAKYIGESGLDLSVCDVDGNGVVEPWDASLILQYDAKYITSFPAEAK